MKKLLVALCVTFAIVVISGCNTVHGFGKDMAKVGDKIADKSEKHTSK